MRKFRKVMCIEIEADSKEELEGYLGKIKDFVASDENFYKNYVVNMFDHGFERLVNDKYDGLFYFPENSLDQINAVPVD